jgi:O-antigen/teichoic acid export membrane protein
MKRAYIETFVTQVLVALSYLLVLRVVAHQLGAVGFGEYTLSRRTLALLSPLAVLNIDVALARFVAYSRGKAGPQTDAYLLSGILVVAADLIFLTLVLLVFRSFFAELFFGVSTYAVLVLPLPVMLAGIALHLIVYGDLRGRLNVGRANLLMFVNHAALPVIAAYTVRSVVGILLAIGLGWILVSIAFLAVSPLKSDDVINKARHLAGYGVPRVPGDLLQLLLFAVPGILTAHIADIGVAGIVAFGISLFGLAGSALTPVSFLLLPVAAAHMAAGSLDQLRRAVTKIALVTLACLLVGMIALEIWASPLIVGYLGLAFKSGTPIFRTLAIGIVPWGIYYVLKSVIDACHLKAVNSRNMAVTFGAFICGVVLAWLLGFGPTSVAVVLVVSLFILAALTIRDVYLGTRDRLPDSRMFLQEESPAIS